jgi:hypothetical protein
MHSLDREVWKRMVVFRRADQLQNALLSGLLKGKLGELLLWRDSRNRSKDRRDSRMKSHLSVMVS